MDVETFDVSAIKKKATSNILTISPAIPLSRTLQLKKFCPPKTTSECVKEESKMKKCTASCEQPLSVNMNYRSLWLNKDGNLVKEMLILLAWNASN